MKIKHLGLVLSALTLMLLVAPAYGGTVGQPLGNLPPCGTFQFDENGNGSCDGVTVQGTLMVDPETGFLGLAYPIGGPVTPGDVGVLESNGTLSDGLRFEDINNSGFMWFFSGVCDEQNCPLADTGFPNGFDGTTFSTTENADGSFQWLSVYRGQSDGDVIPEPSTLLLLGSGLAGAFGIARRRFLA